MSLYGLRLSRTSPVWFWDNPGLLCLCLCTLNWNRGFGGKTFSPPPLSFPLRLSHSKHLLGGALPVFDEVYDPPPPISVCVQANDSTAFEVRCPAGWIRSLQFRDAVSHNWQGDVGPARDGLMGHVHDTGGVGQLQKVFEYQPDLPVLGERRVKNLLENLGEHGQLDFEVGGVMTAMEFWPSPYIVAVSPVNMLTMKFGLGSES